MDFVLVFAAALAFYCATLAPTLIWGDSAWYTLYAALGLVDAGTAGSHPFYVAVGRLFLLLPGDGGRNLAFLSALFGAAAVTLVYRISRQLGTSRVAAAIGAGSLAVSHGFWMHAVIPEVYTANACFLLGTMTLVLQWRQTSLARYLAGAILVFCVGLSNHLVLASAFPSLVVFVITTRPDLLRARTTWAAAGAAAVACTALAVIFSGPIGRVAYRIWVGPPGVADYFRLDAPLGAMAREAILYAAYLVYQFPSIALLLGIIGLRALISRDRPAAALLLLTVLVNAAIFIHHTAWQSSAKFVFYIPDYAMFAIGCAIGTDVLERRFAGHPLGARRRRASAVAAGVVLVPPLFYAVVPWVADAYGLDLVRAKVIAYRDNQVYFLNPNKRGYDGARRFAEDAMRVVQPSAVIFADYTPFSVLRYVQLAEHVRPDVLLRYSSADPGSGDRVAVTWLTTDGRRRPTYIASLALDYYDLSGLTGDYDVVPAGPIYEVRPRD